MESRRRWHRRETKSALRTRLDAPVDTRIQVTWNDARASSYRVYKDDVKLIDSATRSVVSDQLASYTQYCYKVSSLDAFGGESAASGPVCATTKLSAPSGLTVNGDAGPQMVLRWTALPGAGGYYIYKNGALLASVASTDVQYNDAAVAAATWYCYSISAIDASNRESAQTDQVCDDTP